MRDSNPLFSLSMTDISSVRDFLLALQQRITSAISGIDGQAFTADHWQKEPGETLQGNGLTMILEQGKVFERAGCGFSHVRGPRLPPSATQHRPNWRARRLRRWAFRWCSTLATPTCRRCT
jgi:coproporphyrinogen III oxidase